MSSLGKDTWSTTPASNNATPPNGAPEGMAPSAFNDVMRQIMAASVSYDRTLATAGGSANAQTLTTSIPQTSLVRGMRHRFYPVAANTGDTTFAPDGLTAKHVYSNGSLLAGGELQPNTPADLVYDETLNSAAGGWVLINRISGANEITVFTANGNFTPKITGNYLVIGIGGGGGGGGGGGAVGTTSNGGLGGQGGQGGVLGFSIQALTAATVYAVVIGTGGAGGAGGSGTGGGSTGTAGVATTFNAVTIGAGGAAGNGNSGDTTSNGTGASGGTGGGSGGGIGGDKKGIANASGNAGGVGVANTGGGGGGGGGAPTNGTNQQGGTGGTGGTGVLIVIRA